MARTVRDTKLETREARLKLAAAKEPYWKGIDQGLHIGYYKGPRGGSWLARFRRSSGAYAKTTLGNTDDILDADGHTILSFSQAQETARKWFSEQGRIDSGLEVYHKDYTVRLASEDYLKWYRANKGKSLTQITDTIDRVIPPKSSGSFE